jgi:hypothetical protein
MGFFFKKTWRVSLSIGVRITMIHYVVYLLRIFKILHGIMNNPVLFDPQISLSVLASLQLQILGKKMALLFSVML